jgi:hypothetical protein
VTIRNQEATDSTHIVITDDEAMALAAMRGLSWPTVLPTAQPEGEDALVAIVERGARSLYARQLSELGDPLDVRATLDVWADVICNDVATMSCFLGRGETFEFCGGISSAYFALSDDTWLTELTTDRGLHHLWSGDASTCKKSLRSTLSDTVEYGVAPGAQDLGAEFVCVVGSLTSMVDFRVAVARLGEIRTFSVASGRYEMAAQSSEVKKSIFAFLLSTDMDN